MRSQEERFWAKVDKNGPVPTHFPELGPCWIWIGGTDNRGYGRFWFNGKLEVSHRVAMILDGSPPVEGQEGCHRCDNPNCVNPSHTFWGTHSDNMIDMSRKGRAGISWGDKNGLRKHPEKIPRCTGDKNGSRVHPERRPWGDRNGSRLHPELVLRGEQNGNSKLAEEDIVEILALARLGPINKTRLARRYGVSRCLIAEIIARRVWCHVEERTSCES